ncbi:MAG: hypothetical protein H6745_22920 [Deltaproteobacteria bacterium]|nr:hypothetical protein [Deltaproteobacteria bacterium]
MGDPEKPDFHAVRGALNGVVLQLEVIRLALDKGDDAMARRALAAARDAAKTAAERLDAAAAKVGE